LRASEGKKTALLQTLVSCRLVRFANVLFCALAVSDYLSFVAKTPLCLAAFWLVYNVGSYTQGRIAGDFLSSRETD
jgi:hypothetical protein